MDNLTPIYHSVVAQTGIVPEDIYPRCRSLASFTFTMPRKTVMTTPKVGVKPKVNRRKQKA